MKSIPSESVNHCFGFRAESAFHRTQPSSPPPLSSARAGRTLAGLRLLETPRPARPGCRLARPGVDTRAAAVRSESASVRNLRPLRSGPRAPSNRAWDGGPGPRALCSPVSPRAGPAVRQ